MLVIPSNSIKGCVYYLHRIIASAMPVLEEHFVKDIDLVEQIPIVPRLLDVICSTTGMGFAAIARVTEDRWITCSVKDDILFGLKPGDELEVKTTICNEIRQSNKAVVIDHVAEDPEFCNHHTPLQYGFQSYISVPIVRRDGSFFGTLCAIDPRPNNLRTPAVTGMFELFADLIAFHMHAIEEVQASQSQLQEERLQHNQVQLDKNLLLEQKNKELESLAFISSHDLQEPLRKIQAFTSLINDKEQENLSENGKEYFRRLQNAAGRMQVLIKDLISFSHTDHGDEDFYVSDLVQLTEAAIADLKDDIKATGAGIQLNGVAVADVIPVQFRQVMYNLLSNSLKFSKPGESPQIKIEFETRDGENLQNEDINREKKYCFISVADNGIGFDQKYDEKIFELFKRLHGTTMYPGTGVGLTIVKKIIENHHGLITATGKVNEGAVFTILIPVS